MEPEAKRYLAAASFCPAGAATFVGGGGKFPHRALIHLMFVSSLSFLGTHHTTSLVHMCNQVEGRMP